ncbi:uncharacterized protein LOC124636637 [Helicoverpa zea]|uniref:uncharacterized protein LOC124636637 n=1 Tax=Helicoverpa zea TaxID=7113 RepID=UPI001F564086|nr:uncharacterized protein LOC124636637 [Helicoverpa zea]
MKIIILLIFFSYIFYSEFQISGHGMTISAVWAFLVFILTAGAIALQWSAELPPIPRRFGNKTGCYIKEMHDVINFNETVPVLGYCYVVHCTVHEIEYLSCGWSSYENDTRDCIIIEAKMDEPYPKCCPQVVCIDRDVPWLNKNKTDTYRKTKEIVWKL